jgi:hypothetical protein
LKQRGIEIRHTDLFRRTNGSLETTCRISELRPGYYQIDSVKPDKSTRLIAGFKTREEAETWVETQRRSSTAAIGHHRLSPRKRRPKAATGSQGNRNSARGT